jgi:predicted MPP superfamily phosphohydrolase
MKIREYSDMHLDHYGSQDVMWYPPKMPDDSETTLILAGDIWIGTHFIAHAEDSWIGNVSQHFKRVLVVLGNHDYWPTEKYLSIKAGAQKCRDLLAHLGIMNVFILDCDVLEVEDVLFVGCTLWTDMNKGDPLTMFNMPNSMHYDGKIAYETGLKSLNLQTNSYSQMGWSRFTSEKWVQTHYKHRDYLKIIFEQNKDKKIVAITHHLPLLTLNDPRFAGHHANHYYSSDLSDLILDNPHVKLWFYGHTHYQQELLFGETLLVNNCVGYKSQGFEQMHLVKHKVFEV